MSGPKIHGDVVLGYRYDGNGPGAGSGRELYDDQAMSGPGGALHLQGEIPLGPGGIVVEGRAAYYSLSSGDGPQVRNSATSVQAGGEAGYRFNKSIALTLFGEWNGRTVEQEGIKLPPITSSILEAEPISREKADSSLRFGLKVERGDVQEGLDWWAGLGLNPENAAPSVGGGLGYTLLMGEKIALTPSLGTQCGEEACVTGLLLAMSVGNFN